MTGDRASAAPFRVLLVDDQEVILTLWARSVAAAGHEALRAGSGEEAWELYRSARPHVVVTDIQMPGIDGVELLERIRAESPRAEVILVTGFSEPATIIRALRAGASNYLEKPVRPTEVVAQVNACLERVALALEAEALRGELEVERERLTRENRLAALARLLAGLAHEIHNPLTFVKGNAELLARLIPRALGSTGREETTQIRTLLEDLVFGAERIRELVESMKALVAPTNPAARRSVAVTGLVANACRLAQSKRTPSTQLRVGALADDIVIEVTPLEMETCLSNLVANAFEAVATQGGGTVAVSFGLFPYPTPAHEGLLEIEVADDGPGIPQGIIDEVFTPFFTRKHGGTGLGLSLSFEAARRNGAQLELHSEEGEGTRAVIRIPYSLAPGAAPAGSAVG